MSRGEYIARLDDDDIWCDQRKLEKQVGFLETHPDYVLCGGGLIIREENLRNLLTLKWLNPEKDEEIRKAMLFGTMFASSSVVFRKNAYEEVGGYDEELDYCEDWNLWLKLGRVGKLYNFPDYFFHYSQDSKVFKTKWREKFARTGLKLIIKYRNDYPHFYKAFLYFLVSYIYSVFLFPFRGILKPVRSKIRKKFNKFVGISFPK